MSGPYVQVAAICEKALQEADGVLSLIRVVDRFIISVQGKEAPAELPQGGQLPLTFVVVLKSDDARGRHPVCLRVQQPNGVFLEERSFDVMFEGEDRGVNLIIQLTLEPIEGLYWFDVSVNDTLMTRVPLRVIYQRVPNALG